MNTLMGGKPEPMSDCDSCGIYGMDPTTCTEMRAEILKYFDLDGVTRWIEDLEEEFQKDCTIDVNEQLNAIDRDIT